MNEKQAGAAFDFQGRILSLERFGKGHINDTYRVDCTGGYQYILQRINRGVFHDPAAVMENVSAVTTFLKTKVHGPRETLNLVPKTAGGYYLLDEEGNVWRAYDFIGDSICLQQAESPEDFRQSALAFGGFQRMLADFPAKTLHETIQNFHHTPLRYEALDRAIETDVMNRRQDCAPEISFALAQRGEADALIRLQHSGALPLRVTHNDTKLNNVMLDKNTRKHLCVIDLDTVMPGLSAYDFGDSIRFGASSAAEDERDLSKVHFQKELFEIYTEGYLEACGSALTPEEISVLSLGAKLMTLECGVRFLTDYLEGDVYFKIQRPGQNLDRCRTQFQLVSEMEKEMAWMEETVERIAKKYRCADSEA